MAKTSYLKRFLPAVLCIALLCMAVLGAKPQEQNDASQLPPIETSDGYTLIAENTSYQLYADLSSGDFAIGDLATGKTWYSGQWEVLDDENPISQLNTGRIRTELVSMATVQYVQVSTIASTAVPSYKNTYSACVIKNKVACRRIDNGYRAEYSFPDLGMTLPVEITLTDNGIQARIVGSDLVVGDEYRVTKIDLLPGFMAADDRYEDGYIFVPSGSGALMPFASGKGDMAVYNEIVYGRDSAVAAEEYTGETENILVPVYGIKRDNTAVTAIITKGDASAAVLAEADSSSTSFSRVYSEYITAIDDSTTLFESNFANQRIIYGVENRANIDDYEVRYTFTHDDQATYAGMAGVYRDYLQLQNSASAPELALTLYGAATKKASFMGVPYTKTIALTSFDQAQEIVRNLNDSDVPVALKYIGWNNDGIENKTVPTKVSPVSVLGGKKGYNNLSDFFAQSDNDLYYDVDFVTVRKSGNGFSTLSDVCRSIFNTRTPIYKYMRSVYVPVLNENPSYLLKPASVVEAAEKFLKAYNGTAGISLDRLGSELYSDFSKNGTSREEAKAQLTGLLGKYADAHSLAVTGGNAYTYAYADRIFELPTSNDGNLLFSESVPFVQMALHGKISYSVSTDDNLLDCMEFGADPNFSGIYAQDSDLIETTFNWLYGSTYTSWINNAKQTYADYKAVYGNLYNKTMTGHRCENGLSVTEYEDGTKVYVNRGDADATFEGVTIPAKGYTVTGGGN